MNRALKLLSGYGALELKRAYRRNMAIGVMLACAIHLFLIGGVILAGFFDDNEVEPILPYTGKTKIDIGRPPGHGPIQPPVRGEEPNMAVPEIGVPTAVPDEDVPDEVEFVSQDELAALIELVPVIDVDEIGSENIRIPDDSDVLPDPTEFIAYEEAPELISRAMPVYPEMARRAGLTGDVWVQVLIDKNGEVRDVRVASCSSPDVGFEEAAVESAYQSDWKPAISGSHPVAVWASYKVSFRLSDCE